MKERFKNWRRPFFDEDGWAFSNSINLRPYGWRCQYHKNLKMGKNIDIGCFTYMNAKYGIEIKDNVQIGSHCSIYSDDTEREVYGEVIIGEDTLIGAHTVILPGAVIEPKSKIPIGSVIKGI